MKASEIVKEINWCIKNCGDRDLFYLSVYRKEGDTVFIEEITSVRVDHIKINKETIPIDHAPIILFGIRGEYVVSEKFVKLNRFGRLIKRFIFSKEPAYITPNIPQPFPEKEPFKYKTGIYISKDDSRI